MKNIDISTLKCDPLMIKVKTFTHECMGDASVERQLETFINEHGITRHQIIRIFSTTPRVNIEKIVLVYEELPRG